jgi:coatomer subunit beta
MDTKLCRLSRPSQEPMVNLCLELATVGDLKLCERPTAYNLAPGESKHIKANIKVRHTPGGEAAH